MQSIIDKNDDLVKKNQQLDDANYDLRYELQEANKRAGEPAQAVEVPETQPELPSPIDLDFDSKFEPNPEFVVEARTLGDAYADADVNDKSQEEKKDEEVVEPKVAPMEQPEEVAPVKDDERSRDMPL